MVEEIYVRKIWIGSAFIGAAYLFDIADVHRTVCPFAAVVNYRLYTAGDLYFQNAIQKYQ